VRPVEKSGHTIPIPHFRAALMPNHVHLILTPADQKGLGRAVGEAHRRYTNFINARGRWSGHLFQSRFSSVAMDEGHLLAAVRYVSLNPVRAGRRTGPGRASGRIWQAGMTGWCGWARS
jgi:putative transposase